MIDQQGQWNENYCIKEHQWNFIWLSLVTLATSLVSLKILSKTSSIRKARKKTPSEEKTQSDVWDRLVNHLLTLNQVHFDVFKRQDRFLTLKGWIYNSLALGLSLNAYLSGWEKCPFFFSSGVEIFRDQEGSGNLECNGHIFPLDFGRERKLKTYFLWKGGKNRKFCGRKAARLQLQPCDLFVFEGRECSCWPFFATILTSQGTGKEERNIVLSTETTEKKNLESF